MILYVLYKTIFWLQNIIFSKLNNNKFFKQININNIKYFLSVIKYTCVQRTLLNKHTQPSTKNLPSILDPFLSSKSWTTLCNKFSYNNSLQRSTQETPFFLNYGHHPIYLATFTSLVTSNPTSSDFLHTLFLHCKQQRKISAKLNSSKVQQQQTFVANNHRQLHTFNLGDQVLLSTKNIPVTSATIIKKFSSRLIGLFLSLRLWIMFLTDFSSLPPWNPPSISCLPSQAMPWPFYHSPLSSNSPKSSCPPWWKIVICWNNSWHSFAI